MKNHSEVPAKVNVEALPIKHASRVINYTATRLHRKIPRLTLDVHVGIVGDRSALVDHLVLVTTYGLCGRAAWISGNRKGLRSRCEGAVGKFDGKLLPRCVGGEYPLNPIWSSL